MERSTTTKTEDRRSDIFVGVDVFGRGCIGGGGFECKVPIRIIREKARATKKLSASASRKKPRSAKY
jgi:hypothetical protein